MHGNEEHLKFKQIKPTISTMSFNKKIIGARKSFLKIREKQKTTRVFIIAIAIMKTILQTRMK